jgi:hypothetical protein
MSAAAHEIYDMVMLQSALELLDRMPEASRKPILIAKPPPPPPFTKVVPTPVKTLGPRLPIPTIKGTKAVTKEAVKTHKAELKAAQVAVKAAEKEAARLRKALAKVTAGKKA